MNRNYPLEHLNFANLIAGAGKRYDEGTAIPSDGTAGYAPGCIFRDTDASSGATIYINNGTATSCDFDALVDTASTQTIAGAKTFSATVAATAGVSAEDEIVEDQFDPSTRVFARTEFGRRLYTKAAISDWSVMKSVASAEPDWVVSGSGTTFGGSTMEDGGALIKASTSSAFAFIKPRTGSRFGRIKWNTSKEPRFRFVIKTQSSIAAMRMLIGLESVGHPKFLRASAPDSNRIEVLLDKVADSRFHARIGAGSNGSSSATLSGVVAASTVYDIEIRISAARIASVYINSTLAHTFTDVMIANKALIPIIGVQNEGAARNIAIYHVIGSQNISS